MLYIKCFKQARKYLARLARQLLWQISVMFDACETWFPQNITYVLQFDPYLQMLESQVSQVNMKHNTIQYNTASKQINKYCCIKYAF